MGYIGVSVCSRSTNNGVSTRELEKIRRNKYSVYSKKYVLLLVT